MLADPRAAAVDAVVRLTAVLAAQCVLRRRVLQVLSPVYISPLRIFGGIEGGAVVVGGLTVAPGHDSRTRPPTQHK